jgi:hypothetical protein
VAEEVVRASPRVAWTAALQAVTNKGLPLRISDLNAGIIETDYVDIVTYVPTANQYPTAERLVRFRVVVAIDTLGAGTRVIVQGIYRPFFTGVGGSERGERAIPRDHPAMDVVREVVAEVTKLNQRE